MRARAPASPRRTGPPTTKATTARKYRAPKPRMRSTATTATDAVVDPVICELSRTRTMSPPMLLGRKLLKKVATRYEAESRPIGAS